MNIKHLKMIIKETIWKECKYSNKTTQIIKAMQI